MLPLLPSYWSTGPTVWEAIQRSASSCRSSLVVFIHSHIHRLSAYLLADRRNWGSAEREDFKKPKTLENLKDNKDPSGVYLGKELQLGKA